MSTSFLSTEDTDADEAFDAIAFAFMDEWEASEETGKRPTLGEYVRRYPQYATKLTDFILDYVRLQIISSNDVSYAPTLSPEAIRAGVRVREALQLGEYAITDEAETVPVPTFAELMKETNLNVARLSKQLSVKPMFINRIQRGLLSTWSTATVRLLAEAMNRTTDEIKAILQTSLNSSGGQLAGANFSAQGGDPDIQAVQGSPQTLAETVEELGFSPADKAKWLADE